MDNLIAIDLFLSSFDFDHQAESFQYIKEKTKQFDQFLETSFDLLNNKSLVFDSKFYPKDLKKRFKKLDFYKKK